MLFFVQQRNDDCNSVKKGKKPTIAFFFYPKGLVFLKKFISKKKLQKFIKKIFVF